MNAIVDLIPKPHQASFRDPAGFIFSEEGKIYRQVNETYQSQYQQLINSGLYDELTRRNWLIKHQEISHMALKEGAFKVLMPYHIDFISYPHEWSFSQLKDAALRTLDIQECALKHGMIIKDASAYNIQFQAGKPIFIDTLSFENYIEGKPWEAYRQFCQHFLAPLALMTHKDIRLSQLLKIYLDGVPLSLASALLPKTSWLNPGLLMHLHLHAKMEQSFAPTTKKNTANQTKLSKVGLVGILSSLRKIINKLQWKPAGTEWGQYYQDTNYTDIAFSEKARLIRHYLQAIKPNTVWDLGANTGHFSRLANEIGANTTIAFDVDPAAVELNYLSLKEQKQNAPLPLLLDLTNPTPGLGWHNHERDSLLTRGPADCLMALALIHHLVLSNNVPFTRVAAFFAEIGQALIIEFVPKSDSQVQRLLSSRKDIFPNYTKTHFIEAFSRYFKVECMDEITGSERTLFLMKTVKKETT